LLPRHRHAELRASRRNRWRDTNPWFAVEVDGILPTPAAIQKGSDERANTGADAPDD
jgi:hypothetical protein